MAQEEEEIILCAAAAVVENALREVLAQRVTAGRRPRILDFAPWSTARRASDQRPGQKLQPGCLSPEAAGRIAVFRDGAYICHALDPELEGVSRAEVAAAARSRQRASDSAKRAVHRELKKHVKPAAVLESIVDARLRGVDPISAFQVSQSVETQAMAASAAARAAEALLPAQPAPVPEDLPPAERARMLALWAKKAVEDPLERFIRLVNTPIRSIQDQEWMDHYQQTPEGRGVLRGLRELAPHPPAQGTTGL